MKFPSPLVGGTLERRYKRFLADVTLDDGRAITCAVPNTGSMMGLSDPGMRVWLSISDNPKRKYAHTLELVEADNTLVGINTGHPNKVVAEAIKAGRIAPLKGYANIKGEQKYGRNSRIDLLLSDDARGQAYVEIKNVHLMRKSGRAEFPDSVTERGVKHLQELADMVREGHRAVMLFLVQRADAASFSLAGDIDSNYLAAFRQATAAGVEALAYRCRITPAEIVVDRKIPMELS